MRVVLVLCGLLAAVSVGQYIERYIPLPDSFGSITGGFFALDTARARLFLGSRWDRFVLVLDAATGQRIGRIDLTAPCERATAGRFGYNPHEYKLYYSGFDTTAGERRLFVQDIATGTLLASIDIDNADAAGFLYNQVSNKMYCLIWNLQNGLLVIDGRADSVLARFDVVQDSPPAMAFSPAMNRLFAPDRSNLVVIDGAADSLIARFPAGYDTHGAFWNALDNTVVLLSGRGMEMTVVDCATNRVVAECPVSWHDPVSAAFNPRTGLLYWLSDHDALHVVDARAGVVVDSLGGFWDPAVVAVNPVQDKFYVADDPGLWVFDGATNEVIDTFDIWPELPDAFALSPDGRMVHVVSHGCVRLIDGVGDSIVGHVPLAWLYQPLCFNPADGRVYGADWHDFGVTALDGATPGLYRHWPYRGLQQPYTAVCCSLENRVFGADWLFHRAFAFDCAAESISIVMPGRRAEGVEHDPRRHRVWVSLGGENKLVALDCRSLQAVDSVELGFGFGPEQIFIDDAHDRLYAIGYNRAAAVDLSGPTQSWESELGFYAGYGRVCVNPVNDRLYCAGGDSLAVLDGATGQVLGFVHLPFDAYPGIEALACSPRSSRIYASGAGRASVGDSVLAIVDCATNAVRAVLSLPGDADKLALDPARDKLYVGWFSADVDGFAVIDCRGDSVLRLLPLGVSGSWQPVMPVWDWQHDRLFCSSTSEGWVAVIRDTTPIGVAETMDDELGMMNAGPTVVRAVLNLPASGMQGGASAVLLDVTGRKVLDLKAGENDVSRLAPGVYFVRKWGQATRGEGLGEKVVIAR